MQRSITCLLLFVLFSLHSKAQAYPDLSGTWYQNNNSSYPAYIVQNGQYLTLFVNNTSTTASFTSANQLYATTWNAYANISADRNQLTWCNQTWVRANFNYPNIAGTWSNNGSPVTVNQNGKNLEFVMAQGRSKGYFYASTAIYATDWNTYATYDPNTRTIKWGNQTWTSSGNTTPTTNTSGKVCRKELSGFFYAMTALGTVWARPVYEPGAMSARTISDLRAALSLVTPALNSFPCINFDRNRIINLSNSLNSMSGSQVSETAHKIIIDLQLAIRSANITCDRNFSLEQLFIAGIHLGAAQAHASSRICQPVPMPAALQATISAHLTTASNALTTLLPCVPDQQLSAFAAVPLGSMNSVEPHTFIVGLITQTLWAVTLTDCCCTCGGGTVTENSSCDVECDKWCKQQGKQGGRFKGICLLNVPSGTHADCECY